MKHLILGPTKALLVGAAAVVWLACAPLAIAGTQSQLTDWGQASGAGVINWDAVSTWMAGSGSGISASNIWDGLANEPTDSSAGMPWDNFDPTGLFGTASPSIDWNTVSQSPNGSTPNWNSQAGFGDFYNTWLDLNNSTSGNDWMNYCPPGTTPGGSGGSGSDNSWCDFYTFCQKYGWPPGWNDQGGGGQQGSGGGWPTGCWPTGGWPTGGWPTGGWPTGGGGNGWPGSGNGQNYGGGGCPPPVPEPASVVLFALGAALLVASKFRLQLRNLLLWQALRG